MDLPYHSIKQIHATKPSSILSYQSGKVEDYRESISTFVGHFQPVLQPALAIPNKMVKNHLGRFSIVIIIVDNPDLLYHLLTADEKITFLNGKEIYAFMIVRNICTLVADLSLTED